LQNSKKYSFIREKLDNIINNSIASQLASKWSMSRSSTNDITNSSIISYFESKSKIFKNKLFDKDKIPNKNSDKNL
jgi:hypothetical protein